MPNVVAIVSPDDPRVAAYSEIRERDLAGREGLFVAEGEVVLRTLLSGRSRFGPVSILLAENRLAALAGLLANVPDPVPILVAPPAVMERIAGFPIHRGILAIGDRGAPLAPADVLAAAPGPALALGLVGLANHDNVGGAFRNAAAFGVDAVLLDRATCDPLYRKAIRVSAGAALTMPFARLPPGTDWHDTARRLDLVPLALSPGGAEDVADLGPLLRVLLLLGSEGPGLPGSVLARIRGVRIPMAAGFDSLNVATAGAIALHRIAGASRTDTRDKGLQLP